MLSHYELELINTFGGVGEDMPKMIESAKLVEDGDEDETVETMLNEVDSHLGTACMEFP